MNVSVIDDWETPYRFDNVRHLIIKRKYKIVWSVVCTKLILHNISKYAKIAKYIYIRSALRYFHCNWEKNNIFSTLNYIIYQEMAYAQARVYAEHLITLSPKGASAHPTWFSMWLEKIFSACIFFFIWRLLFIL